MSVSNFMSFDKTQYIDTEMIDLVTLWMLRILIKAGGFRKFISDRGYFEDDEVAYFLNLDKYVEMDEAIDLKTKKEIYNTLNTQLQQLESQHKPTILPTLATNIANISDLLKLNEAEEKVLIFGIIVKTYSLFEKATRYLGNNLTTLQFKKVLATILDIDYEEVEKAFSNTRPLFTSALFRISVGYRTITGDIDSKIDLLSDSFVDFMMNTQGDLLEIIKDSVHLIKENTLSLDDYDYIKNDITLLQRYLKKSIKVHQEGVNILLYGVPGTGKTELAKTLAHSLDIELFEVSYDNDDDIASTSMRLRAYVNAQAILQNRTALLLYDEAEDIFDSRDGLFNSKKQEAKGWMNNMLETNPVPTIWITNDIDSVDPALVRRFDITMEMQVPKKSVRKKILQKYAQELLDKKTLKKLAQNPYISPAVIQRAIKVAKTVETKNFSKTVYNLINKTLQAQGYGSINIFKVSHKQKKEKLPSVYDPAFINANDNLEELATSIAETKNARLCLYGIPGTGKSAYGKYIAHKMGKKAIIKKGSDLLSKWVGGTEANIAAAFEEAKKKKAVLIFDEVDSFLQDRTTAHNSWEVTQVNEMLTQMESFHGVFIATTNLLENLDVASLRRFDLKMEFKALNAHQAKKLFENYVSFLSLQEDTKALSLVSSLKGLTPGDFTAVTRQNKFRPLKNALDLAQRLQEEVRIKSTSHTPNVGFL